MEHLLLIIPVIGATLSIVRFFTDNTKGDKLKHILYISIITILFYVSVDLYNKNKVLTNKTSKIEKILNSYKENKKIAFIISAFSFVEQNKDKYHQQYEMIKIYKNQAMYYQRIGDNKNINKIAENIKLILLSMK